MSRRLWIAIPLGSIAIAAIAGWWFLVRSDAPPPVDLDDAVAGITSTTTTAVVGTTTTTGSTSTTTPQPGIDATWTVAEGSFAGYRVREELAGIGVTTAVGRSTAVDGSLVIARGIVTSVEMVVDVTRLRSDQSRRDNAIRRQALETDRFPAAGFVLTDPITLPSGAATGERFAVDATGDLTIHGVTRRVTIPLDARLVEGVIVVVGTTRIVFEDFGMSRPLAAIVVSVEGEGDLEFELRFTRG